MQPLSLLVSRDGPGMHRDGHILGDDGCLRRGMQSAPLTMGALQLSKVHSFEGVACKDVMTGHLCNNI